MAQPQAYNREHQFTQDETADRAALDSELDDVSLSINQIRDVIAGVVSDQGDLMPGSVGVDQLSKDAVSELTANVIDSARDLDKAVADAQAAAVSAEAYATDAKHEAGDALAAAQNIIATGDEQTERIKNAADEAFNQISADAGFGCTERVWTVTDGVSAEGAVTLPDGMKYVVGRNHLRLAWNGCELMRSVNFAEIGDANAWSVSIKMLMPISAGDEMMAWTVPLGRGDMTDADVRLNSLEDSLADLSRRVVYKDE